MNICISYKLFPTLKEISRIAIYVISKMVADGPVMIYV